MYLNPKNHSVSFQKRLKMFCFHHFKLFTRCRFQNVPIRVPFSKCTVFKICRQKMCRFRVNSRPIRHIFCRFQNVPASCERSLSFRLLIVRWSISSIRNIFNVTIFEEPVVVVTSPLLLGIFEFPFFFRIQRRQ